MKELQVVTFSHEDAQEARYELDAKMIIWSSTKQAIWHGLYLPWTKGKDGDVPAQGIILRDTVQKWIDTDIYGSLFDPLHMRTGLTRFVRAYDNWIKQIFAHNTFKQNEQGIFVPSRSVEKPAYNNLTSHEEDLITIYVWVAGVVYILKKKLEVGKDGFVVPQAYQIYWEWQEELEWATTYGHGEAKNKGLPPSTVTSRVREKCKNWRHDLESVQLFLPEREEPPLPLTPPSLRPKEIAA